MLLTCGLMSLFTKPQLILPRRVREDPTASILKACHLLRDITFGFLVLLPG